MPGQTGWRALDIAVIGGGIGGLSAAISLRRAGHTITLYERAHYANEVGASISCAANGTKWLHSWSIPVSSGDPVVLQKLIHHDWKTGEEAGVYDLGDYEQRWGDVYNMFHRQCMHGMLMAAAVAEEGEGAAVKVVVDAKCVGLDTETGVVRFEDGRTAVHEVVIGADGIGSAVRKLIGITPDRQPSNSSCLHANVLTSDAVSAGLKNYSLNSAIEYWGGSDIHKIVLSPCNNGRLLSYYCFFPREKGDFAAQNWNNADYSVEDLLRPFPDLDEDLKGHFRLATDIRPWRLWVHQPYEYWQKGVACLMGDAAHPMMPDQSQGACMAIEDAAALGLVFSRENFSGDVREALRIYEAVRKPRATRVQEASARARENINERIGFSSNTNNPNYKVADESNKLTVEEMNLYDMHADVRAKKAVEQAKQ